MHRPLAIVTLSLFGAIAGSAQVREQITVEAVDVPVYVVSKGKPVRQLSKDDFELYVNGKLQPIDYFETVDFTAPASALANPSHESIPAAQPQLRDRRLFLFLFDLVYNEPSALDRSRRAAVEMVNHALPDDLFAVATVTSGKGIVFASPFLRDRDAVRRAILQLAPSRAHDALAISITGAERETAQAWTPVVNGDATGKGKGAGPMSDDLVPELLALSLPEVHAREAALSKDQVQLFGELALRLRELDGYKHVILFSKGFRIDPGSPEQFRSVSRMAAAFQSANAFLHTLDLNVMATGAGDLRALSLPNGPLAPAKISASENQSLLWMSAMTGGKWIHWTNELAPALDELSASYSATYRLGFKPVNARKDHNDIKVKVKNLPPGATVSFRKGFAGTSPSKSAPDALRLADIVQNDTPQSGTPPEISVIGRRLDVIVPVIQLSKQLGAVDRAQVMLYVYDANGVPVFSSGKTFTIPKHAAADRVIEQKLDLRPGSYFAKVLLRAGDSLAFVKEPFQIEASQPSQ
jgi:VWFA-related protein